MKNVITLGILFTATIFIVSCGDSTEGVKSTAGGKSPKESIANHGDDSAEYSRKSRMNEINGDVDDCAEYSRKSRMN